MGFYQKYPAQIKIYQKYPWSNLKYQKCPSTWQKKKSSLSIKIFALDQLNNLFIHQWRIGTVIRTLFSLVPYSTIKRNSKKLAKLSRHAKISNIRQLSPIPFVIQLSVLVRVAHGECMQQRLATLKKALLRSE